MGTDWAVLDDVLSTLPVVMVLVGGIWSELARCFGSVVVCRAPFGEHLLLEVVHMIVAEPCCGTGRK